MTPKNKSKRCRLCGSKVKSNMRFCKACWEELKRERNEAMKCHA